MWIQFYQGVYKAMGFLCEFEDRSGAISPSESSFRELSFLAKEEYPNEERGRWLGF